MEYQHSPLNFDCLIGSLKLARGAAKAGVKRFIGIGTCAEYDQNQGILSIDSAIKPKTPYAAAKTSLFFALSQWLPAQSISFAWCRLFYLYGEGEDGQRLVPYIRTKLALGEIAELTSGKQIRDYIDVAEAGKKIATVVNDESYQGPINICSGVPVTVRQLAEKIADEFGRRDLLRFDVRPDNIFDPHCVIGR
jgi:dTDP-6-deoxy-L-talose 4-dehydrogenase (NAD+)